MKSNGRFFAALLAGLLLLLVCGYIGWKVSHPHAEGPGQTSTDPVTANTPSATNDPVVAAVEQPTPTADDPDAPPHIPEWQLKLDDIVTSDNPSEEDKAEQIAALLPHLPPEAQNAYARQMYLLLDDTNYTPAATLLTSPTTATNVFDVLFTDFVMRGNALKIPLYLDILKVPNHPQRDKAREVLNIYLREDYGDRWDLWEDAIQRWLRETRAID